MILLSAIIEAFEAEFLAPYQEAILPGHTCVLSTMKRCRTSLSPKMLAQCCACDELVFVPHACGLALPERYPEHWVVDCKCVGSGTQALVYLGRYLYRGVLQEKDIVACRPIPQYCQDACGLADDHDGLCGDSEGVRGAILPSPLLQIEM